MICHINFLLWPSFMVVVVVLSRQWSSTIWLCKFDTVQHACALLLLAYVAEVNVAADCCILLYYKILTVED